MTNMPYSVSIYPYPDSHSRCSYSSRLLDLTFILSFLIFQLLLLNKCRKNAQQINGSSDDNFSQIYTAVLKLDTISINLKGGLVKTENGRLWLIYANLR